MQLLEQIQDDLSSKRFTPEPFVIGVQEKSFSGIETETK